MARLALQAWPKIDLIDEREANQFRAVVWRPENIQTMDPVGTKLGLSWDQVDSSVQLTAEHKAILTRANGEHAIAELMTWINRSNRSKFRNQVLAPLLAQGLMTMTIPERPRSSKQRYRLTQAGVALQVQQRNSEA